MDETEPMPLIESAKPLVPVEDHRPRLPEPLPVKLVAVEDVTLYAQSGLEHRLDAFYAAMLGFEREADERDPVYRADNARLRIQQQEGPLTRAGYRTIQIEVASLPELEKKLIEREVEYTRQRGLLPGAESLLLQDPAGNWVELVEARAIL